MGERLHSQRSVESRESKELFRASLGFDFVFHTGEDGTKRCYCVEVNGHNSGIRGITDLPREQTDAQSQMLARVRMHESTVHQEWQQAILRAMKDSGENIVSLDDDARESLLEKHPPPALPPDFLFKHAFQNPSLIEWLAGDKRLQTRLIPQEHRPRIYFNGSSLESSTGYWILKPVKGATGEGIRILSNIEFAQIYSGRPTSSLPDYFIQEFIPPDDADKATDSLQGHAAAMRLLLDFTYAEDGTITPVFKAAYQRASQYSSSEDGKTMPERYVVNRALDAKSVAVSDNELRLAEEVARKIIHNLAESYRDFLQGIDKGLIPNEKDATLVLKVSTDGSDLEALAGIAEREGLVPIVNPYIPIIGPTLGRAILEKIEEFPVEDRQAMRDKLRTLQDAFAWTYEFLPKAYLVSEGSGTQARKSIIQLVTMPDMLEFYTWIEAFLDRDLPKPLLYVPLFATDSTPDQAINISSEDDFKTLHPVTLDMPDTQKTY